MPNTISANDVVLSGTFDIDITGTANAATNFLWGVSAVGAGIQFKAVEEVVSVPNGQIGALSLSTVIPADSRIFAIASRVITPAR